MILVVDTHLEKYFTRFVARDECHIYSTRTVLMNLSRGKIYLLLLNL
jgi:hypothetical protein